MRTITLKLDEDDYDAVQATMGLRQTFRAAGEDGTILPPGESDLAGAVVAEICRGWVEMLEYRPR